MKTFEFDSLADEYVAGGFNADMKEFDPDPDDLEAVDIKDEKPLEEEPEEDEPEPEPEAKEEPEKADEPEPEPEPEPVKAEAPKAPDTSAQYDFLLAQTARQAAVIEEANRRLAELGQKPIEEPNEQDWIDNPTEAAKKAIAAEKAREAQAAETQRQENLRAKQNEVYSMMADKIPLFKEDTTLQQRWANVFWSNPDFRDSEDGPIRAAQLVAQLFPEYQRGPEPTPRQEASPPPEAPAIPPVKEDTAESGRTAALKKGVMHSSGQRSKSQVVNLNERDKKWIKMFGVSEDSYKRVM